MNGRELWRLEQERERAIEDAEMLADFMAYIRGPLPDGQEHPGMIDETGAPTSAEQIDAVYFARMRALDD